MPTTELERDIRGFPLFAGIGEEVCARISRVSFTQVFPADITLFWQGNEVDFVHGLVNGHVELSAYHNSRQYTVMMAGAGFLTPLAAVAGSDIAHFTARTVTRSRVVMIPVPVLRSLAEQDPKFLRDVFREAVSVSQALLRESHSRNLQRSSERLASWIYRHLKDGSDDQEIELAYNKRLLASVLGVSPATLARDIEYLAGHGVTFRGRKVRIRSVAELVSVANLIPELKSSLPPLQAVAE
jgi:CRP/FNR family transcriptional regulator, transcriptional activator FtrB